MKPDPVDGSTIRPLPRSTPSHRGLPVILAALVGAAEIGLTALALAPRLPAQVPAHYDLQGHVDSMASVPAFVEIGVGGVLLLGAGLGILLYALGRSEVLELRHGRAVLGPVTWLLVVLVGLAFPLPFWGTLASAAGVIPLSASVLAALTVAIELGSVGVVLLVVVTGVRAAPPLPSGPSSGFPSAGRYRSGPVYQCAACGERFVRSSLTLLAPRLGVSVVRGGASYYLRCPICGERGWSLRVGWHRATPPAS